MPLTPFHFGPHACVGLAFRRRMDVPVLIASNIAVDVEPLLVMVCGLQYPLHGYCHTFLGGGLVGLLLGLVAFLFRKPIANVMSILHLPYAPSLGRMLLSGVLGAWLHILFDAPLYADIQPFYPLPLNPFLNIVSTKAVYVISALLIIPALAMYLSISGAHVAPSTGKAVGASPSRGRSRWMSRAPRRIKARFALPTGGASQADDPGCKPVGIYNAPGKLEVA